MARAKGESSETGEMDAETLVALAPEPAFAWLADPRNASAWFASVRLERPPAAPLGAGSGWRFLLTRQRDRPMPMRMAEYAPATRFAWETEYPTWRGNLRWVFTLATAEAVEGGEHGPTATRLGLRIEQRPGPLGWPLVALAWALQRLFPNSSGTTRARAQRAIERARDALESAPPTAFIAYGYGPTRGGRGKRGPGR
jgi:hypothetical protein